MRQQPSPWHFDEEDASPPLSLSLAFARRNQYYAKPIFHCASVFAGGPALLHRADAKH
jgi:hypothetical protein